MSTDIEVVSTDSEVAVDRDLTQLAVDANRYDAVADRSASTWLMAAVHVGRALLEAQRLVPLGSWITWIAENLDFGDHKAAKYMRVAAFEAHLVNPASLNDAEDQLTRLGRGRKGIHLERGYKPGTAWTRRYNPDPTVVENLVELRAQGTSWKELAAPFGVARDTVHCWVDPEYEKQRDARAVQRHKEAKAARRALKAKRERDERERLVRSGSKSVSAAYAEVRRALQHLDSALLEETQAEIRTSLRGAMSHAHRAEDAIVAALKGKELSNV